MKFLLSITTVAILFCTALAGCKANPCQSNNEHNYDFDTTISRPVLENYLSRSLNLQFMYGPEHEWPDAVRMVKNVKAKLLGRTIGHWGSSNIGDAFFEQG